MRAWLRLVVRLVAGLGLAAALGCSSVTTMREARVLDRGETRWLAALETSGGGQLETYKVLAPEASVGVRRGLGARTDVGLKLTTLPLGEVATTLGAEIGARVQLYRRPGESRWEIAVGPGVGVRRVSSSNAAFEGLCANLPLIVGVNLGRHQLVMSPEVGVQRWVSIGSSPLVVPYWGWALGFAWRVGQRVTLLQKITALRTPVAGESSVGSMMLHAGFGVLW